MIRRRLATKVTGASTSLPSSDSRYKKGRDYPHYLQVWVSTGKVVVEAMLSDVRLCYQAEIWILAQYQSLP